MIFIHGNLKDCLMKRLNISQFQDDIDKYKYSGYGIGFDSKETFSHPSGKVGRNVIIFGADMSSFVHANNKTRSILVLGEVFTQEIDNTTLYTEKNVFTSFQ